jgi:hypothetical protein
MLTWSSLETIQSCQSWTRIARPRHVWCPSRILYFWTSSKFSKVVLPCSHPVNRQTKNGNTLVHRGNGKIYTHTHQILPPPELMVLSDSLIPSPVMWTRFLSGWVWNSTSNLKEVTLSCNQGNISSFFFGFDWFDYGASGFNYQTLW